MKNKPNFFLITGVSQTGGVGGPPLGNFSHIIPFFPLMATLIKYSCIQAFYRSMRRAKNATSESKHCLIQVL